jgi:hypothetical protein
MAISVLKFTVTAIKNLAGFCIAGQQSYFDILPIFLYKSFANMMRFQ